MQHDTFKVISEFSPIGFEQALNQAGEEGYKVVPLSINIGPSKYEAVMGKTVDPERAQLKERASKSGITVLDSFDNV